jgi:dinuclear metal center YbgI/SA1388 family protein
MITVGAIADFLDQSAPPSLAAEWDNTGLLVGGRDARVERLMTCLTVTSESAAEAVDSGVRLIVTHHPVLFRPVQRLTTESPEGRVLLSLIRAGVAVYSPHTAFDDAPGGINELLAARLDLTDLAPLRPAKVGGQYKVVVFTPDADLARVSDAVFAAGAGRIGQYGECSFRLAGTGTFFGSEATNPAVGQPGRREEVSEWRLEVICPAGSLTAVVAAIRRTHSYEEPALDIYPLHAVPAGRGQGRIGRLKNPLTLGQLARATRDSLKAGQIQWVGDSDRMIEKVGIACGAGGEFLSDALRLQADVLLTGEMRFHDYLAARAQGLALLLPGHYATERFGVEELAARLGARWPELQTWASRREQDPVQLL